MKHGYKEIPSAGHGSGIDLGMPDIFAYFKTHTKEEVREKTNMNTQPSLFKKSASLAALGLLLIGLVQLSTSAAQSSPAAKPAGMRVFYASHSLMWDVPPVLQQEAEAYGMKGHTVLGIQRLGVSRTEQHWNLPDNQNEAKKALQAGNVDAFVMSPIALPDEGIDNFVKLGLKNNPNMKFFIQVSWPGLGLTDNDDFAQAGLGGLGGAIGAPPAGGAPGAGARGAGGRGNNFTSQAPPQGGRGGAPGAGGPFGGGAFGGAPGGGAGGQNYNKTPDELAKINIKNDKSAEEQAAKLNKEIGKQVVFLIPTSQVHNALRLAIYKKEMPGMTDQGEVFLDFIGHPTPPVVALNTYVHFATLYNRSPIGLPMPNVLKNGNRAQWDEKMNQKLQEMAWNIVSHYPPSGVKADGK